MSALPQPFPVTGTRFVAHIAQHDKWVDNTGNLMHITRHSEPVLTLEIECNPHVDEALV